MDDLFGQIEYKSKSDSTVMKILRSAMDKAHENVQSMDGPVEFLHKRSTFYELAAILVDGGLSIVQEEMDILEESSHGKIVSDLKEIKQWLQGRIQDMKLLIIDKDKELAERLENESKLLKILELKDREIVYLHEKMRNHGFQGFTVNEQSIKDGATEEDISKLKSSVDQQVWNLKQKLEDEEKILTTETPKSSSSNLSLELLDKVRNECSGPDQNNMIRRMSSDIDVLKETLDLAFGRMKSAEVLPLEKQWRCTVEKDIEYILVKGFIRSIQQGDGELMKKVGILNDTTTFDFINEMKTLCYELKSICCSNNEVDEKKPTISNQISRTSSEPLPDIENLQVEDHESRFVLKMIKNHESIIREKSKESKWLTLERKLSASSTKKRDDSYHMIERRIQNVITKLENLIEQKRNSREIQKKRRIPKSDKRNWEHEIRNLIEQRDVLSLQISLMKDIYTTFFREMAESWELQKNDQAIKSVINEDIYHLVIAEAVKDSHPGNNLQECTPRSRTDGDGTLIQTLDSLSRCLEAEEDLMLKASSEIKEHSVNNSLVILNCEEIDERNAIEWLLTDDESMFTSVSEKLERALQQLYASKDLLVELELSLEVSDDIQHEETHSFLQYDDQIIMSHNVLVSITQFQQVACDFEQMVRNNLEKKCLRVQGLKYEVDMLHQPVAFMKRRKSIYKKGFISRCCNLRLAEKEVDLLGDQVETLLCLLELIYVKLNQNAKVISHYFEVFDILKLIRTELNKSVGSL